MIRLTQTRMKIHHASSIQPIKTNYLGMKKLYAIIATTVMSYAAMAQITINRDDFYFPNDWYVYGFDTVAKPSWRELLQGGVNKTWDLTGKIQTIYTDTTFILNGATYPTAPAGCNLVEINRDVLTGEISETFLAVNDNGVKVILDGSGDAPIPGALQIFKFPATYLTNFKDSIKENLTFLATELGFPSNPLIDSARIEISLQMNGLVDGWGRLIYNSGNFETIRQKNTIVTRVRIGLRNILSGSYTYGFIPDIEETINSYTWMGKQNGNFLLQIETDENDTISEVKYLMYSSRGFVNSIKGLNALAIKIDAWPNPASQQLTISYNAPKADKASLTVYNVLGKVMLQQPLTVVNGNNETVINIELLPAGIYFYEINSQNITGSGRFLKQ
jgi:hypothetical protein